jgi:ABC-type multidrug transport system fused ATPase/permease subunit
MPTSEVDFLLTECFPKASSFVFHFTQTFSFAIQVALMTSGMLFLAFGEALTGIAGLGVMALVVLLFNRMAQRVARKVPESGAKLHRIKTRSLRNWMLIKVLHIQEREYRGFIDAVHSGFRHNSLAYLLANLSLAVMPVVGVLVLAAIVTVNVQVFHTPTASCALTFLGPPSRRPCRMLRLHRSARRPTSPSRVSASVGQLGVSRCSRIFRSGSRPGLNLPSSGPTAAARAAYLAVSLASTVRRVVTWRSMA